MSNTWLGLAVGLALGFAAAFGGPSALVIVLGCGAAGLFVGRVIDGAYDLATVADSMSRGARRAHSGVTTTTRGWWSAAGAGAAERAYAWRLRLRAPSNALSRIRRGIRTRTADMLGAWSGRLRGGALEETAILDLRHLTDQTAEIRPRRGLARLRL
jgi:hypothetical protein